ncbi:NAD-dependent epimerase/dehydratase family protein [Longimicrobium sp.]|uniref:NAD-dependent epimerase/dehydratase family protein n=1 Tax=Longimicrobium sp. TaxID=2029185 RepID=UPI003B3A02A0
MSPPADVLVVGSGGFVGRALVPALRAAGLRVAAATRSPRGEGERPVDIADAGSVRALFASFDAPPRAVVHLAAIAHKRASTLPAGAYEAVNHQGVRHVLAAARAAGAERFVFFSSASVYGDAGRTGAVPEDAELRPVGEYGTSKARAEEACRAAIAEGFACAMLRFPAMYAGDFLLNVRKRAYVPGTGDRVLLRVPGRPPRHSLCAVANAVDAVRLALGGLPPGAWNVTDGAPYAQDELARVVGALDGVSRGASVPRPLARLALWDAAAALPAPRRASIRDNYWKLFEGLVLDDSRIRAAGYAPAARLDALLSRTGG